MNEWDYRGTLQNPRTQKIIVNTPKAEDSTIGGNWKKTENKWGKGKGFLRLHIAGECKNLS